MQEETFTVVSVMHKSQNDSWGPFCMQTPAEWQPNDWHLEERRVQMGKEWMDWWEEREVNKRGCWMGGAEGGRLLRVGEAWMGALLSVERSQSSIGVKSRACFIYPFHSTKWVIIWLFQATQSVRTESVVIFIVWYISVLFLPHVCCSEQLGDSEFSPQMLDISITSICKSQFP